METPKSISKQASRPKKYDATPKLHERKKSLFTKTRSPQNSPKSDDSDLGLLSPIYLSSDSCESTTDEELPPAATERLLSSRKKLQHIAKRYSDVNKYEMICRRLIAVDEEDDDDSLVSPKALSSCLSEPSVLLTPCDAYTGQKDMKMSCKKTLSTINSVTTPDHNDMDTERKSDNKESRARASLIFNDNGAIPANLFYSSSVSNKKPTQTSSVFKNSTISNVAIRSRISAKPSFDRRSHGSKRKEINRGVFHKIRKAKPKKKMSKVQLYHAAMKIVHENKQKIGAGGKSNTNDHDALQRKEQFERLRSILRKATKTSDKNTSNCSNIENDGNGYESDVENNICDGETDHFEPPNPNMEPPKQGKFFKSKSEKKAKYQVLQNLSVNIDHGKIQIDQSKPIHPRPKKRKHRSLFEEGYDAEVEEVHDEVVSLLKDLERDVFPETPQKATNMTVSKGVKLDSPTTTKKISSLTSEIAEWNVSDNSCSLEATTKISDEQNAISNTENSTPKFFPLFYKNQQPLTSTNEPDLKKSKTGCEWKGFGETQLQIDAGQKAFGAIECKTCGFIYTQHVPEDEILHNEFHNSTHILNFKGWEKENIVVEVPEWGVGGRIIAITRLDSKPKLNKAEEVLRLADLELGFAEIPLGTQSITYLACNHNQIIGICVAQPQREANKLISDFGIDFCSTEIYDVK